MREDYFNGRKVQQRRLLLPQDGAKMARSYHEIPLHVEGQLCPCPSDCVDPDTHRRSEATSPDTDSDSAESTPAFSAGITYNLFGASTLILDVALNRYEERARQGRRMQTQQEIITEA